MANFDNIKQKMVGLSGIRMEVGNGVTIASIADMDAGGQTFTVATKLKKVLGGFGIMVTDGMVAVATAGIVSAGQVTFTRKAPRATETDTMTYQLFGY